MKQRIINASTYGGQLVPDPSAAAAAIASGTKPVEDPFQVFSDAGFFGPTYLVFSLPHVKDAALFWVLRIQIEYVGTPPPQSDRSIVLYDVTDIPRLLQTTWTVDDYTKTKEDLSSGRTYGNFTVRQSPTDDGRILEVPLSYDAMFDINAAAGKNFAIGVANGDGWLGEGEAVKFRKPSDGGVVQLVIRYCYCKRRRWFPWW